MLLQHLDNGKGDLGGVDPLLFDLDVFAVLQDRDRRRIGAGSADPQGLELFDEARFVVARRRLGEVLFRFDIAQLHRLFLLELGKEFVLFAVAGHPVETVKDQFAAGGFEDRFLPLEEDRLGLELRLGHLAGQEAVVDEAVEFELVRGQIFGRLFRCELGHRGADRLVGLLGSLGLGGVIFGLGGQVAVAELLLDEMACFGYGLFGQVEAVGPHIGDDPHGPLVGLDPFVEFLGHHHGLFGRETELGGGGLLEGGGHKGRRGFALAAGGLDGADFESLPLGRLDDTIGLFPVFEGHLFDLFAFEAVDIGLDTLFEDPLDAPVLFGFEGFDLPFPIDDEFERRTLDPSGGEALLDLAGQQGREFVSDDPVQQAPGLLGIHTLHVDMSRVFQSMLDSAFGDLVKDDAGEGLRILADGFGDMVADRFSFAVFIRRDIDGLGFLGQFLELFDCGTGISWDGVFGDELPLFDGDAEAAFGQIPNMPFGGDDFVVLAQKVADGPRFGGRLDDDEVFHIYGCLW